MRASPLDVPAFIPVCVSSHCQLCLWACCVKVLHRDKTLILQMKGVRTLWIEASSSFFFFFSSPFISTPFPPLTVFFFCFFLIFLSESSVSRGSKFLANCEFSATRATETGCHVNTGALHHLAASLPWQDGERERKRERVGRKLEEEQCITESWVIQRPPHCCAWATKWAKNVKIPHYTVNKSVLAE